MIAVLCALGGAATIVGWRAVKARRASVWLVMGLVNGAIGLLALLTGRISVSTRVDTWQAVMVGAASGVGLYVATAAFVLAARRWPVFDRHVRGIYALGDGLRLPVAVVLVAVVYAPGEEIFWRGLVQGELGAALAPAIGAMLAWLGYLIAESASASLPIVAAAIVAGSTWTILALWTDGVVASIVSHVLWTCAMLLLPPGGGSRAVSQDEAAPGGVRSGSP